MGFRARATTGTDGLQLTCGMSNSDLKTRSLGERKKDIWSLEVGDFFEIILGKLLGDKKFNLLATWLVYTEKFLPNSTVRAASAPGIRAITVGGRKFREQGQNVYEQKSYKS